ncbi:MAG: hypothetical protein DLM57_12695 [Pseudonocardiales bacterium]|nr:MAG: hypothetical protein DLM57_12695 [Pseudonocardiales bacterium]
MITAGGLLSGHAHFLHWGVVQISLANLLVIVMMAVLFLLAVIIPFPHAQHSAVEQEQADDH